MKKEFGKILQKLREERRFTRENVAELLTSMGAPVNARHVQRWEWGHNFPTIPQFLYLCKLYCVKDVQKIFLNADLSRLLAKGKLNAEGVKKLREYMELLVLSGKFTGDAKPEHRKAPVVKLPRKIPYYENAVSAGLGAGIDTDELEMITVPECVPEGADFAVGVSGDSMAPTLADGDVIYVKAQNSVDPGDIGVFFLNGSVYVKEFRRIGNKGCLYSHNSGYAPIDISEYEDFKVFGKVLYPAARPNFDI